MRNLDLLAAKTAQEMIANTRVYRDPKDNAEKSIEAGAVDTLVTKALGVLQENGVYAVQLYLYSRTNADEERIAKQVREGLLFLLSELGLRELPQLKSTNAKVALAFLTEHICNNLDTLLMVKQLWEQTLIYARYGAKARSVEEKVKQ